jgi:hypothetical protein
VNGGSDLLRRGLGFFDRLARMAMKVVTLASQTAASAASFDGT